MDLFTQRLHRRAQAWRERQWTSPPVDFEKKKSMIVAIFSEEEHFCNCNMESCLQNDYMFSLKATTSLMKCRDTNNLNSSQNNILNSSPTSPMQLISTKYNDKYEFSISVDKPSSSCNEVNTIISLAQCEQFFTPNEKLGQIDSEISYYTPAGKNITSNTKSSSTKKKIILANVARFHYIDESDSEHDLKKNENHGNTGIRERLRNIHFNSSIHKGKIISEIFHDINDKEQENSQHFMNKLTCKIYQAVDVIVNDEQNTTKSKSDSNINSGKKIWTEEVCEIQKQKDNFNEVNTQDFIKLEHQDPVDKEQEKYKQILNLSEEVLKQDILKKQCTKAVAICKSHKGFCSSLEYLEAERLLLLFSLRHEAAEQEIYHLEHTDENCSANLGSLFIENISFPLSGQFLKNYVNENCEHWFVCVGQYHEAVHATQASMTIQEDKICFTDSLCFKNLSINISVKLMLFYLKLKKKNISHEEKYHIEKGKKKHQSPIALKSRRSKSCPPSKQYIKMQNTLALKLIASKPLNMTDFARKGPHYVDQVEIPNIIKGNIYLQHYIELNIRHSGFLDIMEEYNGRLIWEKYWCRLLGYVFSYWKYPSEEDLKSPVAVLDLRTSCYNKVKPVDRHLCPRPRTLLLTTGRDHLPGDCNTILMVCKPQMTIIRNFWSAVSQQELTQWCCQINKVLSVLENWNMLNAKNLMQKTRITTTV